MADPGEVLLDAYFKMHAQRAQAQQFAQDLQLRQAGQAIQQQQLAQQGAFQQAQISNMTADNERQERQLAQTGNVQKQNYGIEVAKLLGGNQGEIVQPGASIPGAIGVNPEMAQPGNVNLPGVGIYHPYTPQEDMQHKIVGQQMEADLKKKQSYKDLTDFLDLTKSNGIEFDQKDRALIDAHFSPGGGKDLSDILVKGRSTPKETPGEAYARIQNSIHDNITQAAKTNPALLHDPVFIDKARKADQVLSNAMLDFQRASAQVSIQPGLGNLDLKNQSIADFKAISQEVGDVSYAANPKAFNKKIIGVLQSGKYSPDAIEQYVKTQTAGNPGAPKNIGEVFARAMADGIQQ